MTKYNSQIRFILHELNEILDGQIYLASHNHFPSKRRIAYFIDLDLGILMDMQDISKLVGYGAGGIHSIKFKKHITERPNDYIWVGNVSVIYSVHLQSFNAPSKYMINMPSYNSHVTYNCHYFPATNLFHITD